jgi:hypothetical protein
LTIMSSEEFVRPLFLLNVCCRGGRTSTIVPQHISCTPSSRLVFTVSLDLMQYGLVELIVSLAHSKFEIVQLRVTQPTTSRRSTREASKADRRTSSPTYFPDAQNSFSLLLNLQISSPRWAPSGQFRDRRDVNRATH